MLENGPVMLSKEEFEKHLTPEGVKKQKLIINSVLPYITDGGKLIITYHQNFLRAIIVSTCSMKGAIADTLRRSIAKDTDLETKEILVGKIEDFGDRLDLIRFPIYQNLIFDYGWEVESENTPRLEYVANQTVAAFDFKENIGNKWQFLYPAKGIDLGKLPYKLPIPDIETKAFETDDEIYRWLMPKLESAQDDSYRLFDETIILPVFKIKKPFDSSPIFEICPQKIYLNSQNENPVNISYAMIIHWANGYSMMATDGLKPLFAARKI